MDERRTSQDRNPEELEVASLRGDGTLRKPTPIWVVRIVVVYRSNAVRNPLDGCYSETC